MPRNHTHNLNCISATSSTDPKLRGRLWFCNVLGQHLEGPDPNAEMKKRLLRPPEERLREIAAKHGLILSDVVAVIDEIRRTQGWGPREHHPAIAEAWNELPGHYSYASAANAMRKALLGERI